MTASDFAGCRSSTASPSLYIGLGLYRVTGLLWKNLRKPAVSIDVMAARFLHAEEGMREEAIKTGLFSVALREQGNGLVKERKWEAASRAYSYSLATTNHPEGYPTDAAEGRTEELDHHRAKALANRSFVHLKMAEEWGTREPAPEWSPPQPLRGVHSRNGKGDKVNGIEGASASVDESPAAHADFMDLRARDALPRSHWFGVLAFADAVRATDLSPTWSKGHVRRAEAARFLAVRCMLSEDQNGRHAMHVMARAAYQLAAEWEPHKPVANQYLRMAAETSRKCGPDSFPGGPDAGLQELLALASRPAFEPIFLLLSHLFRHAGVTDVDLIEGGWQVLAPPELHPPPSPDRLSYPLRRPCRSQSLLPFVYAAARARPPHSQHRCQSHPPTPPPGLTGAVQLGQ
jgi:hypothetical protein